MVYDLAPVAPGSYDLAGLVAKAAVPFGVHLPAVVAASGLSVEASSKETCTSIKEDVVEITR